jgi:hypothetical protein
MTNISPNRCRPITFSEIINDGMRLGQFCPIMREKSIDASGDLNVDRHSNSVTGINRRSNAIPNDNTEQSVDPEPR